MNDAPFIGIARHRLTTDGEGVTTLVCFWGCELRCKYCINPMSFDKNAKTDVYSPLELYDKIKCDALYFEATGGGVTFGGGEPLLYPEFIKEFSRLTKGRWRITLESALQADEKNLLQIIDLVEEFFVDIKDTDPAIYKEYTGRDIYRALNNLKIILNRKGSDKVIVRLPLIPGFNTEENLEKSERLLREMGIQRFDKFKYTVR